jgi:hypothetical protein
VKIAILIPIALLLSCDSAVTYRRCEELCAPLKVQEYQPLVGTQPILCKCSLPKEGFAMESNVNPVPVDGGAAK